MVTMATSYIFIGIGVVLTDGAMSRSIGVRPPGQQHAAGMPIPLWVLIAALIVTWVLLNKTRYGFEVKMVGSNPVASRFSGINNHSVLIKTYLISGILARSAAWRYWPAPTPPSRLRLYLHLQAILCAVLGATNPNGGFGKVSSLTLSLISLQLLSSGFNMLRLGGQFRVRLGRAAAGGAERQFPQRGVHPPPFDRRMSRRTLAAAGRTATHRRTKPSDDTGNRPIP